MLYDVDMVSKAQIKANTKWEHNALDKITLRIRKDGGNGVTREEIQRAACSVGMSVNEFILNAIKKQIGK